MPPPPATPCRSVTRIRVAVADGELAADALWQAGASAVEERDDGDGTVTIIGDAEPRELPAHWHVERVEVLDDGLDGWRSYARALRAGERLVVQPPWAPPIPDARPDDIVVVIDPGHAFGSGSHITTRLVLAELERRVDGRAAVLDVGCGSGVLAIAAAQLGAPSVVAIDTDAEAVRATIENARRSAAGGRVDARVAAIDDVEGDFSVVVANIDRPVLGALAPALTARVAAGGVLVLSGMLDQHVDDVIAAFADCEVIARSAGDGWSCLVLRPRSIDAHAGRL